MEALYLLIPLSLGIVAIAAWIFLRMAESGQFEDLDSAAYSILHDDEPPVAANDRKGAASCADPEPATGTHAPDVDRS